MLVEVKAKGPVKSNLSATVFGENFGLCQNVSLSHIPPCGYGLCTMVVHAKTANLDGDQMRDILAARLASSTFPTSGENEDRGKICLGGARVGWG